MKRFKVICVTMVLSAALPAGRAQNMPGSLQGSWKVKRSFTDKSSGCFDAAQLNGLIGARLSIGVRQLTWTGIRSQDLAPRLQQISAIGFKAKFGLTPVDLGLPGNSVALLQVNPSPGIPINALIVRDASTILIDACNTWLEAERDGLMMDDPLRAAY